MCEQMFEFIALIFFFTKWKHDYSYKYFVNIRFTSANMK